MLFSFLQYFCSFIKQKLLFFAKANFSFIIESWTMRRFIHLMLLLHLLLHHVFVPLSPRDHKTIANNGWIKLFLSFFFFGCKFLHELSCFKSVKDKKIALSILYFLWTRHVMVLKSEARVLKICYAWENTGNVLKNCGQLWKMLTTK